jgi:uncharacterized protein (TIGR03067 family)
MIRLSFTNNVSSKCDRERRQAIRSRVFILADPNGILTAFVKEFRVMTRCAMQWLILAAFFGAAAWPVAAAPKRADSKKDAIKNDLEGLEGDWTIVSKEVKGQKSPDEDLKEWHLTVKGDQWTLTHVRGTDKATIRIDPTKDPKTIDLTFWSLGAIGSTFRLAPGRKITSRGIYKLEYKGGGIDTLTLCREDNPRVTRPKEFKTTARAGMLLVFKRQSK